MKHSHSVSALALTAMLGFASQASADTRLLVNCFWPSSHFACSEILPGWIDEVERVTEGRVRGIIPPRSVAPPPEQLAAVVGGVADVSVSFNGFVEEAVGARVAMMPFVAIRNAERMSRALWATNRQFFPDEVTSVHLLSQFVIGAGELYSQTDTPINSIEDLASRRMWVLPGPLARIAAQIGSGVVSTPAVESNEIISRGVVDGHLGLDPQGVQSFQLLPYTRSTTRLSRPIYTTSFSVFINNDTWAGISPEDQEAIMSVSGDVLGAAFGARWDAAVAQGVAAYADAGVDVVDADPAFEAALVEASRFVTTGWLADAAARGIDGQAALDFYIGQLSDAAN
jgi:TRAP-type C4-dicarboxylate transport system substrate-binding protein